MFFKLKDRALGQRGLTAVFLIDPDGTIVAESHFIKQFAAEIRKILGK